MKNCKDTPAKETSSVETSKSVLCQICGSQAVANIIKDRMFMAVVQMHYNLMGLDVKPNVCSNTDLCESCFNKLVELNETNETLLFLENYASTMRLELLQKTLNMTAAKGNSQFGSLAWINQKIENSKLTHFYKKN